ncbi:hypothetical protein DNH61_07375 [Paenibacillus sambharensis]|uniref:Uncharacterized protein n=1 Tax=Paenibacillus sambharensis TaxID=1803190 RepID=A0A2W1LBQ9_9BACL|nr:hypothetical protein [Paenibacillus sambharensis]PZD96606.1 hypothetical protein DNH61_07375 [Paenibacillus sambharensis]
MAKSDRNKDRNTDKSENFFGIFTPAEREDNAATDPIDDAVAGIMDNIEETVTGHDTDRKEKPKR